MSDELRNAPLFFDEASPRDNKARLGLPTASNFGRILTAKGNPAIDSQKTYFYELLAERIFGVSFQKDVGGVAAVKWGRMHEAIARADLEKTTGAKITPAKFVLEKGGRYGASPDGYIFDDEPVEIKCPMIPNQMRNLLSPPDEYRPQIMGQMLVTGASRAHFWSWSPYTPPAYVPLDRDKAFCDLLEKELIKFCDRLDQEESRALAKGFFDVTGFLEARDQNRL